MGDHGETTMKKTIAAALLALALLLPTEGCATIFLGGQVKSEFAKAQAEATGPDSAKGFGHAALGLGELALFPAGIALDIAFLPVDLVGFGALLMFLSSGAGGRC
jgi:hypothetical protein